MHMWAGLKSGCVDEMEREEFIRDISFNTVYVFPNDVGLPPFFRDLPRMLWHPIPDRRITMGDVVKLFSMRDDND